MNGLVNFDSDGRLSRRRAAVIGVSVLVLATAVGAALTVVHSGAPTDSRGALAPIGSDSSAPSAVSVPSEPVSPVPSVSSGPQTNAVALPEGFGGALGDSPVAVGAPARPAALPRLALPSPPPIDWTALTRAVAETRAMQDQASPDQIARGVSDGLQAAAAQVTNLILYAAYSPDGQNFLTQLQTTLDEAGLPAIAGADLSPWPQVTSPDFAGLSAAYQAVSEQPPPLGISGPPPELPPDQAAAAMEFLDALSQQSVPPPSDLSSMFQPVAPLPTWLPSNSVGFPH